MQTLKTPPWGYRFFIYSPAPQPAEGEEQKVGTALIVAATTGNDLPTVSQPLVLDVMNDQTWGSE